MSSFHAKVHLRSRVSKLKKIMEKNGRGRREIPQTPSMAE